MQAKIRPCMPARQHTKHVRKEEKHIIRAPHMRVTYEDHTKATEVEKKKNKRIPSETHRYVCVRSRHVHHTARADVGSGRVSREARGGRRFARRCTWLGVGRAVKPAVSSLTCHGPPCAGTGGVREGTPFRPICPWKRRKSQYYHQQEANDRTIHRRQQRGGGGGVPCTAGIAGPPARGHGTGSPAIICAPLSRSSIAWAVGRAIDPGRCRPAHSSVSMDLGSSMEESCMHAQTRRSRSAKIDRLSIGDFWNDRHMCASYLT